MQQANLQVQRARASYQNAVEEFAKAQNRLYTAQRIFQASESDRELAVTNYQKALNIHPNDDSALRGLGKLELTTKSPEKAIFHFSRAVDAHPNSILSLIYLGYTYLELNQHFEAIPIFQELLQLDPNNLFAHMGMNRSYSGMDQVDMDQAAANIEHSQFFWDSRVNLFRQEETNFGGN